MKKIIIKYRRMTTDEEDFKKIIDTTIYIINHQ